MLIFALSFLGLVISIWESYWPIVLGVSLSWASMAYLRRARR